MNNKTYREQGFALPVILITAMSLVILMLALSQAIMSMRNTVNYSYYSQLAEESAEAGTVYAEACIEKNGREPGWTTTNPLTQSSDCYGSQHTYDASTVNGDNASIPIRFTIGAIEKTPSSVNIPALGLSTMPGASTPITGSVSRSITWATDLIAARSVSGAYRTCGIMTGAVYCWGRNAVGQLGNGTHSSITTQPDGEDANVDKSTPVKVVREPGVMSGKTVVDMFAAAYHNCALTSDGKVYCWGYNANGQLGTGDTANRDKPVEVKGALEGKVVTAIGGAYYTSCAIAEGKIYCWGHSTYGTAGTGASVTSITTPTLVKTGVTNGLSAGYTASKLSTSGSMSYNMCAIVSGKAYCWGRNRFGEVGDNSTTTRYEPRAVTATGVLSGKTITDITSDGYDNANTAHACVVADGKAYCWGDNGSGVLGNNSTTDSSVPVAVNTTGVLSGKTITRIVAGQYHTCALTSEKKVACWGNGQYGRLGNNSTTTSRVPVHIYQNGQITHVENGVTIVEEITDLGGGTNRGCAVVVSGKTYCWGVNSTAGQIGDGTRTDRTVPTESTFFRPQNNNFIY